MSAADLATYRLQLKEVEASCALRPDDADLRVLADSLREMIAVTEQLVKLEAKPSTGAPAAGAGSGKLKPGDTCEALYGDGNWYPAQVVKVSADRRTFTVTYVGYDGEVEVDVSSVRATDGGATAGAAGTTAGKKGDGAAPQDAAKKKRAAGSGSESEGSGGADPKGRKKQKSKERQERFREKTEEQNNKQSSWLSFAKKKAKLVPGMAEKSIFASPTNYKGRVGVVGSGKGVTQFSGKKRHEFDANAASGSNDEGEDDAGA